MSKNTGKIIQIVGVVIDVEFEESLWWQGPQLIEEDVRESSTGGRVLQLSGELKEGEKQ